MPKSISHSIQQATSGFVNTGIDENHRRAISDGLGHFLADTYTLYLKTHNFHWNVTGPMFPSLHKMFEEEYQELASAVDEIAERIRALGFHAPGTYRDFIQLTSIEEADGFPSANEMIQQLMEDQEAVARTARSILPIAQKASDQATLDLLTERMQAHEKTAWKLRSLIESHETSPVESKPGPSPNKKGTGRPSAAPAARV